jgi:hypothetical protein
MLPAPFLIFKHKNEYSKKKLNMLKIGLYIKKVSVQKEILNYNEMSFVFFNCNDKSSTFIVHKETVI